MKLTAGQQQCSMRCCWSASCNRGHLVALLLLSLLAGQKQPLLREVLSAEWISLSYKQAKQTAQYFTCTTNIMAGIPAGAGHALQAASCLNLPDAASLTNKPAMMPTYIRAVQRPHTQHHCPQTWSSLCPLTTPQQQRCSVK